MRLIMSLKSFLRQSILIGVCFLCACINAEKNSSIEAMNEGIALVASGQYQHGIERMNVAAQIYPANDEVWYNLGQVYVQQKKWKEAIRALQTAVLHKNDSAIYYYKLGQAQFEYYREDTSRIDTDELIDNFTKATELDPTMTHAYWYLGHVFDTVGEARKAAQAWNVGAKISPDFDRLLLDLGALYLRWGYLDQAIAVFEQGLLGQITNKESLSNFYYHIGLAHQENAKWTEAITAYSKTLDLVSNSTDALLQRGIVYHYNGDKDQAQIDLKKYLDLRKGTHDLGMDVANGHLMQIRASIH